MRIVCLVFDHLTALDIVGPTQVLGSGPDTEVIYVSPDGVSGRDRQSGLGVEVQGSIDDVDQADILLIPGGFGTRALIQNTAVIDWVKRIHPGTQWTGSICTGALVLAAAGLLTGRTATTHWYTGPMLQMFGATYVEGRVVVHESERLIMAAGVSAGIDMGLDLAARLWGEDTARAIQLSIEYDPQPPFDAGSVSKAGPQIEQAVRDRYERRATPEERD